jgi:foldase protein PrsA
MAFSATKIRRGATVAAISLVLLAGLGTFVPPAGSEVDASVMVETVLTSNGIDRATVAAVVDGTVITQRDANDAVALYRSSHGLADDDVWAAYLAENGLTERAVRIELVRDLVDDELLGRRAEELGIEVTDDDVSAAISEVEGLYPSHESFLSALSANGYTESTYRDAVRRRLVRAALCDAEVPDALPTHQQIEQYAQTVAPTLAGRRSSQILFSADDYDLAMSVLEKLNNGADFAQMAQEYSIDPSGADGGDVGWDSLVFVTSNYEDALSQLEVGEVAGPLRTRFGYHLIKCTDVYEVAYNDDGTIDLGSIPSDLLQLIEESAEARLSTQLFSTYVGNLEATACVALFDADAEQVPIEESGLSTVVVPLVAEDSDLASEEQQPALDAQADILQAVVSG